jgi:hypothetical protein
MGSRQADALQRIQGSLDGYNDFSTWSGAFMGGGSAGNTPNPGTRTTNHNANFDSARVTRSSTETRPINAAYYPRIHA